MKTTKIVLGILAGAAVGAMAGVLFAPAKGSKTRKRILRKGEDYYDSLKDKFDDLFEDASNKFEKVKKDVTEYVEKTVKS